MLHTPTPDGAGPSQINGHPVVCAAGPPLGVIGGGAIQRLAALCTIALLGKASHFCIQADIFKIGCDNPLRICIAIGPVDDQSPSLAPHAVAVDGHNLQGHVLFCLIPVQSGNIIRRVGSLHHKGSGAIGIDLINLIGGCTCHRGPVYSRLGSIGIPVQNFIQGHLCRTVQGRPGFLREGQLTQVHLIVGHIISGLNLKADGVQRLARQVRQVHMLSGPDAVCSPGQGEHRLFARLIAVSPGVSSIGNQAHKALVSFIGETQLHTAFDCHFGAIQHDLIGLTGSQIAIEPDGVTAVIGIVKIIAASELLALGVNDPGPSGQHILVGLITPFPIPGKLTIHIVALAVTRVKVGHKGNLHNRGLVGKEARKTGPLRNRRIRHIDRGVSGIPLGIDIVALFRLMEFLAIGGQAHGHIGTKERQG